MAKEIDKNENIESQLKKLKPKSIDLSNEMVYDFDDLNLNTNTEKKPKKSHKGLIAFLSVLSAAGIGAAVAGPIVVMKKNAEADQTTKEHKINVVQPQIAGWQISCNKTAAKKGDKVIFTVESVNNVNAELIPTSIKINTSYYPLTQEDDKYVAEVVIECIENMTAEIVFGEDPTPIVYKTVTFDSAGGTAVDAITIPVGTVINAPQCTWDEHHHFIHWYQNDSSVAFDFSKPILENCTLHAKWDVDKYTVIWQNEDGSELKKEENVEYGSTPIAPTNPTKPSTAQYDYIFSGWDKPVAPVTADVTYKATFTPKIRAYTVEFITAYETVPSVSANYGETISKPDVKHEGHTLIGWYKEETYENEWNFATDTISGQTKLYAKWEINSCKVSFDLAGGEGAYTEYDIDYGETLETPSVAPTKEGCVFKYWTVNGNEWIFKDDPTHREASVIKKDITLTALWENEKTFVVNFDTQGGSAIEAQKIVEGKHPTDPGTTTKTGYTFKGWYTAATGGEQVTDWTTQTITTNKTYYAQWTPEVKTVTFTFKDGTTQVENVNYGEAVTNVPTLPTVAGFEAIGWSHNDTTYEPFDQSTLITQNMILYAHYEAITVTGIEIVAYPSKSTYYKQTTSTQTLDLTGMSVKLIKSDGSTETVSPVITGSTPAWTASGFDVSSTGEKTITLTHTASSKTVTFKINVVDQYKNLVITQNATHNTFYKGQPFEAAGLAVKLIDYEGNDQEIDNIATGTTFVNNKYTISGSTATAGMQTVTITHTASGMTGTYTINVAESQYTQLIIDEIPTTIKTFYKGQNFDATGLKVHLLDYEGTTKEQATFSGTAATGYTISGSTSSTGLTDATITHTASGLTATYSINVVDQYKQLVVDNAATTTTFTKGGTFNAVGLKVHMVDYTGATVDSAECTSGSTLTGYTISSPTMTSTGMKIITVTHNTSGLSTSYTINVVDQYKSISIDTWPATSVTTGTAYDPSGLVIKLIANTGSDKTITYGTTDWTTYCTITTPDTTSAGEKEVTITFTDSTHLTSALTFTYKIYVHA